MIITVTHSPGSVTIRLEFEQPKVPTGQLSDIHGHLAERLAVDVERERLHRERDGGAVDITRYPVDPRR